MINFGKKWRTVKSIVLKINKTPSKLNQPKGSHTHARTGQQIAKIKENTKFIAGSWFLENRDSE